MGSAQQGLKAASPRFWQARVLFVVAWCVIMVAVFLVAQDEGRRASLQGLALHARHTDGLLGILFSPWLHFDGAHLTGNLFSFSTAVFALLVVFPKRGVQVFLISWLLTSSLVWLFGRPVYHIGASGVIYAVLGFLFFGGLVRRERQMAAISLAVLFINQGFLWGVLPQEGVSWESHLLGLAVGLGLAIAYRKHDPHPAPDEETEDPELPDRGVWDYDSNLRLSCPVLC